MEKVKVLAIPGSLRKASLTRQLVRSLQPIAPPDVQISVFYLDDIPIYNQDIENAAGFPPAVAAMREQIEAADGLIFATPEYNGAMPGALKNAIDWASRGGIMAKRPVAPISGSPGALGATKAQESLRSVLNHLGMHVLSRPAVAIPKLNEKLMNDTITDEMTQQFVTEWLATFRDWIVQLNK
ncbi:MAG: NAD(P)H-dependent oxidoreductase [Caldilineaceae bacterium]